MKLTVVVIDNSIGKDNVFYDNFDLSSASIPSNVWALQWENNLGHIEYNDGTDNLSINVLPDWANVCVSLWETKNTQETTPVDTTPTADDNKAKASMLLQDTDWVENPSVIDANNTPHLLNKNDFDSYRIALRVIAVNPQEGNITFPVKPIAQWSN